MFEGALTEIEDKKLSTNLLELVDYSNLIATVVEKANVSTVRVNLDDLVTLEQLRKQFEDFFSNLCMAKSKGGDYLVNETECYWFGYVGCALDLNKLSFGISGKELTQKISHY